MGENELCGGERRLERIKEDDGNHVVVMNSNMDDTAEKKYWAKNIWSKEGIDMRKNISKGNHPAKWKW